MRRFALAVALIAAAPPAAAADRGLEVPDPQPGAVRLMHRADQRVGYVAITVRNATRRSGRVRIQYLPDRRAEAVDLPRPEAGWIQLVDPARNTPVTKPPRIAGGSVVRLGIRVSLPDDAQAKALDGRLVLQLQRGRGPVGEPAVVRLVAARSSGVPLTQIGVAAAVLGTAFAALAAWLSHKSAEQSRLARLEDQLPQVFAQGVENGDTGSQDLRVRNGGGGLARNVSCCLESNGASVQETIAAFVPPGGSVELSTTIRNDAHAVGVVYCWDVHGDCYIWDLEGERHKASDKDARRMTAARAFRLVHNRDPAS